MTTVNQFYKSIFGEKVYKISLDAGCTCPNRDGTKGYGGCIFCSQTGSGDFTANKQLSITQQIEQAKKLIAGKTNATKYIAYFQNFTNTYGNPQELKSKWEEALKYPGIVGLALGTRPDCLNPEILEILKEISQRTFLQVELGLQTANEKTAQFINRGFSNSVYQDAVKKLNKVSDKIHIVTHIFFGLPLPVDNSTNLSLSPLSENFILRLETLQEQMDSVKLAIDSGTSGIKITVLYVLKNTKLQNYYKTESFKTLEMEEYFDNIKEAIKIIPENIIIHRLTGDPPKKLLIAPEWTANKKNVLNRINQILK